MKIDKYRVIWAISLIMIIVGIVFYHPIQHWLAYATGSYNCPKGGCPQGSPHNYNFFSGSGSDIGQYTVATAMFTNVAVTWKMSTCPAAWWCWRKPHYQLGETPHLICGHHHPDHKHTSAKEALKLHIERHHKDAPVA